MALPVTFVAGDVLEAAQLNSNFSYLDTKGSGLVYLTGAAFTTATSFSLPNGTFTSSYRNYLMFVHCTALTSDADFTLRLRASGSDAATNYDFGFPGLLNTGTASNGAGAAATSWAVGEMDAASPYYALMVNLIGPQLGSPTLITATFGGILKNATAAYYRTGAGSHRDSTVYDAVSFISSVASSVTGVYRVYGYADS